MCLLPIGVILSQKDLSKLHIIFGVASENIYKICKHMYLWVGVIKFVCGQCNTIKGIYKMHWVVLLLLYNHKLSEVHQASGQFLPHVLLGTSRYIAVVYWILSVRVPKVWSQVQSFSKPLMTRPGQMWPPYINPCYCSELGGGSAVSSQSSVIVSGLWPSIIVDVLMAQLVRVLAGWARRFNPRPGR